MRACTSPSRAAAACAAARSAQEADVVGQLGAVPDGPLGGGDVSAHGRGGGVARRVDDRRDLGQRHVQLPQQPDHPRPSRLARRVPPVPRGRVDRGGHDQPQVVVQAQRLR
ncbi:MAG TPA: hypothetical protein VFX25_19205 [Streptosporangiaceae bacterium]|nr:hypothetical protein [Streptosporangiaceae bacterium]